MMGRHKRTEGRRLLITVSFAAILAGATAGSEATDRPQPTTSLLTQVHNARMFSHLREWLHRYARQQSAPPASIQLLIRHMPQPSFGVAWLWLIYRDATLDYEIETRFSSRAWAVGGRSKSADGGVSLFMSSELPNLLGGDAGGRMGHSGLPTLDLFGLEKQLERRVEGPSDVEALLDYMIVRDAQEVLHLKNGYYACNFDELVQARAAGNRLISAHLPTSRSRFDYELVGIKGSDGHCTDWMMRAKSRLEGFASYEMGGDFRVWVIPPAGPRKNLRLPLDEWRELY